MVTALQGKGHGVRANAVGDEIVHYLPWKVSPAVTAGGTSQRWGAIRIGDALNTNS